MTHCVQCNNHADIHINWLARVNETENTPQECDICNECLKKLVDIFKNTQFGQTLTISNINKGNV